MIYVLENEITKKKVRFVVMMRKTTPPFRPRLASLPTHVTRVAPHVFGGPAGTESAEAPRPPVLA